MCFHETSVLGSDLKNDLELISVTTVIRAQSTVCVCILSTSYKHGADRKDLLGIGVGRHVAKAYAGQAAQGEVERGDVDAADGGTGPVHTTHGAVGRLQAPPKLMEPSWGERQRGLGNVMNNE